MLRGIDPILSPDLLHALASMGHGDTVVIADANFPAATNARRLLRMPGLLATDVLRAVLTVLPIDTYVPDPARTMQVVGDAGVVPEAVAEFARLLIDAGAPAPVGIERHAFYEQANKAYAIVQTGERRLYGNIILMKGVVDPA